jgi:RNA polymerase sigma-70 factor (ECF subfamily)
MASSWTRTASERDDLLQDISVALLNALPSFRGDCPERAFVWRIAHNRALAAVAARRRANALDTSDFLENHESSLPSPHEVTEQHERTRRLHHAISLLRDDQRVLVVLALEGLGLEEIASVVGGTANAVGVRLHRARAALIATCKELERPSIDRRKTA